MIDFTITAIESIELYDSGMEMVKKNIPDAIKVSASTFRDFCQGKNLDSHPNTISEQTAYLDEYGNVVAGCIRKEKFSVSELEDAIQSSLGKGNVSLINSLAELYVKNRITLDQAKSQLEEKNLEVLNRTIMQMKMKMM